MTEGKYKLHGESVSKEEFDKYREELTQSPPPPMTSKRLEPIMPEGKEPVTPAKLEVPSAVVVDTEKTKVAAETMKQTAQKKAMTPNEVWEKYEADIVLREYDSDDKVRLKSCLINVQVKDGKEHLSLDMGLMQKVSIVCGVKNCPWFADSINEDYGVTEQIYNKRWNTEFRKIPTKIIDKLFLAVKDFNKEEYDTREFQKN